MSYDGRFERRVGRKGVVWRLCSPVFADHLYVYLDPIGAERVEKTPMVELRDVEPIDDALMVAASVVDGKVESISFSGRYPILSDNPGDYQGTGFADFMATVLPSCRTADEGEFYRNFWAALVKPREFTANSGKWRFTDNGVSKSYASSAYGSLCGLSVSSFSSTGRTITDTGRDLSGSSQEVTFRFPKPKE